MKNKRTTILILSSLFLLLTLTVFYFLFAGPEDKHQKKTSNLDRYDKSYDVIFEKAVNEYRGKKYKEAIKTWKIILDYAKEKEIPEVEIHVSTNIGAAYNAIGYHKTALTYFLSANRLYEKMNVRNIAYWTNYLNIGVCYTSLEQMELSKKYLDGTKDYDDQLVFLKNYNLANWYGEMENRKEFHNYKLKVDQHLDSNEFFRSAWNTLEMEFMIDWKDTTNLEVLIKRIQPRYHDEDVDFKIVFNSTYLFLYQKLYEPIENILAFDKEIQQNGSFYLKIKFYNLLKDYYLKQKDFKKGAYYLSLLLETTKAYSEERNMLYVEDYKTSQVLDDLKNKYSESQLKNQIIKGQLARSKARFVLSVILIVFILILVFLMIKNANKTKVIHKLKQLQAQNQLKRKEIEKKELSDNLRLSEEELNSSMVSIKKILLLKKQLYDLTSKNASPKDDELIKQINLILNSFFDNYRDLNYLINRKVNVEKIICVLKTEFPSLNERELLVVEYVLLQFTTKEIALLMDKSEKSIEYNRTQIRKKMNLNSENTLENYLSSIE